MSLPKKKVLIVRFSSIGDIVLTTPVVRAIADQTDFEIHYLTKKPFLTLLDTNPNIQKTFGIDKKVEEVINELKLERYTHIIDLHRNLRTRKLSALLKVPILRFDKINIRKWLAVQFKKINGLPDVHIVDRYLDTIKEMGVGNDDKGLDFFIQSKDKVALDFMTNPYISVAIGAQHFTKQIPQELLVKVLSKYSLPLILIGGEGDHEKGEQLKKELPQLKIINTCGEYSIAQSSYLVEKSKVLITADTGMMHIAVALNVPIVSVWGNTIPEFGMYPYADKSMYTIEEVQGLGCRPCSKIGFQRCPKGHFKCMLQQDVNKIQASIDGFLKE